ncbi:hypothetical protein SDRG_09791 [Saprolegnia diclina VS20]|uniref:Uncharacterized protein n=2 Tax=Saprolegnia TaxID=4769 RepID=A0A067D182_SAPPC|nr:hypothetical protein SDRG_09791 [Saprolegnia diclina VS20]XP_012196454.1 hypothetical protein SPRG_02490 [Saprolegnia parasitica CBS 223.65]EQC32464.1 hypothetical protein SDRG_09791 [Saprolegnia diclina VS20]KDO32792.1 hypothetical protein SPRG_02490 [Saprolegnia parasitica CBS 223.65]|eukprot:XP_008613965.1 hypothetical protein SDRG_09791 [Saprolegnia diclina VS20]
MATNKATATPSGSKPIAISMNNPILAAAPPNPNGGMNMAMAPAPSAAIVAAAAAALSSQHAQQQQQLKRMGIGMGLGMGMPGGTAGLNAIQTMNTLNNMNVAAMQLQMNQHQQRINVASANAQRAFKPTNVNVNSAVAVAVASASNVPVPVVPVNTAGAGALNLSGTWDLDREASDSTNDYLEAMGLPLIARQAADKLDLTVIILQTPGEFTITRRTRIFLETKVLKFGQDVIIKTNTIKVIGEPTAIKTITHLSGFRGVLTDIRTLDELGRMKVELTLTLPDKDKPNVVITRYFKKLSDSTSLDNLPPFEPFPDPPSEKRKR